MLRIFADENISSVVELFRPYGHVATAPGREITRDALQKTDVLLVRSVTRVNAELLANTPVRFVGTATAGTDHVDVEDLRSLGVQFVHAPGSNAPSVGDYVIAAILTLSVSERRRLRDLTCAVIGCGAVGGRLATRLEGLGLGVLRSDQPLDDSLKSENLPSPFVDPDAAIEAADIVTLHVPLHDTVPYSTFGLLGGERMHHLKDTAWIINTSRGLVVNEPALIHWMDRHPKGRAVIDVWADEPDLSCELARRATLATPHIAGYALDGKRRATIMLRDAMAVWLGEKELASETPPELIELEPELPREGSQEEWLHYLVRSVYDIGRDHHALLPICDRPASDRASYFESLRHSYPARHEMSRYRLPKPLVAPHLESVVRDGLGMEIGGWTSD